VIRLGSIVYLLGQVILAASSQEGFDAYDRSVAMVRAEIARHSRSAELSLVLGRVHFKAARFADALRVYEEGQRAHPDDLRFVTRLGRTYLAQGRLKPAIDSLERALKSIGPGSSSRAVRLSLADAYTSSGEFSKAIVHLRAAAREGTPSAEIRFKLGRALDTESRRLRSQGEEAMARTLAAEARQNLEEAVRLRPSYADAHYALGRLLARSGEKDLARKRLEDFRRLKRKKRGVDEKQLAVTSAVLEAGTAVDLARALSSLGETKQALDYAERALEVLPRFEPALVVRGTLLLQARPTAANYTNLAVTLFEAGKLAECEKVLRTGLARYPGHEDLLTRLRVLEDARKGKR